MENTAEAKQSADVRSGLAKIGVQAEVVTSGAVTRITAEQDALQAAVAQFATDEWRVGNWSLEIQRNQS
ncbi:hypothetical protein [Actinoplanes sp. NBRC 103695]|uniref:hypothetical protein n=1 Tax=Actinoplanes sp. NBRC 103695 TaxID=3032202 RepID=UPI00249FA46B|nr:hypothetical protein [Actinoplanes sp. NBRC 103695]GLY98853.1 hypothetical protein Acsp02_61070 [Actinoplanes sp. NBRC 103695]